MEIIVKYWLILLFVFGSCSAEKEASAHTPNSLEAPSYISFTVDSLRVYDNTPGGIALIVSPIDSLDKIWFLAGTQSREFDLERGETSSLASKYAALENWKINSDRIWKDYQTGDVYISDYPGGTIRFNKRKKVFEHLDSLAFTHIVFKSDKIIFGFQSKVRGGQTKLFSLDREGDQIVRISDQKLTAKDKKSASTHDWVGDTIIFDGGRVKDNSLGNYGGGLANWRTGVGKTSGIPGLVGKFKCKRSNGYDWYLNSTSLYYLDLEGNFYEVPAKLAGNMIDFYLDEKHVYIRHSGKFVIYNKDYLFQKASLYDTVGFAALDQALKQDLDSLRGGNFSFSEYLDQSIKIYKKEEYLKYPSLAIKIETLPRHYEDYSFEDEEEHQIASILSDEQLPDIYRYNILKSLCRKYLRKGDLAKGRAYLIKAREAKIDENDYCIESLYPALEYAVNFLDSIGKTKISEEAHLYWEAQMLKRVIESSCWHASEMRYNYSLAEEKYQELLSKYPNSKFAERIECWRLMLESSDEGWLETSLIRAFLEKFPDSKMKPGLLVEIAINDAYHFWNNPNLPNSPSEINRKTMETLRRLGDIEKKLVPGDGNKYRIEALISDMTFGLQHDFYFVLEPSKTVYALGEDIEVDLSLSPSSKLEEPAEIDLYRDGSHFAFRIFRRDKEVKFVSNGTDSSAIRQHWLHPGKPLVQRVNLSKSAREFKEGQLGKFNFSDPGTYVIYAYTAKGYLSSNSIHVKIE